MAGVADNSQFFLDNMIVGAGPEALFELSQMLKIVSSFFILRFVTVEAKSQRSLENFEETEQVAFGELVPNFIFAFMSACIYFALAPIVNFAVAIYFIVNYKVFHHQALFVYAQKHDGGGRIMYLLNRMIFVTLYVSIVIFFSILSLKGAHAQATTFFYSMALLTLVMDLKIQQTFVQPSATLALLKAREIDEQTKVGFELTQSFWIFPIKLYFICASLLSMVLFNLTRCAKCLISILQLRIERGEKFRLFKEAEKKEEKPSSRLNRLPFLGESKSGLSHGVSETEKNENAEHDSQYLFRQPFLDKLTWETKPRPYR